MISNESTHSSSTSSYSSAEATPKSSPKLNSLAKPNGANKRSSSDGAMIALEATLIASKDNLNHQRSRSDCDDLVITTKARMAEKFDQLELESGLKLKKCSKTGDKEEKQEFSECEEQLKSCAERVGNLSMASVKEQAFNRMRSELSRAQTDLKLSREEVSKLSRIREEVESELEDLTASLFEEANHMVYNANVLRSKAQKELYEANLKIEVLQAEVQALKMLVLTSTPSNHSSVRVNGVKSLLNKPKANNLTKKSHSSNYELGGSAAEKLESIAQNGEHTGAHQPLNGIDSSQALAEDIGEVDPYFHEEFLEWKKCPNFEPMNSRFIKRIYDEEIYPVFNFKDKELTAQVLRAIEDNTIIIEAVGDKSPFPKRCALLDAPRSCKYRMKLLDGNWHNISELVRNRIIAVCDLFCYLRYIERGLVKSSFHEVYWQVIRRRRNIALSRLGFSSF